MKNAGTGKLETILKSLSIWKTKIQPWLSGKTVDDAPTGGEPAMLKIRCDALMFFGPFATIVLRRGEKWEASVSHCANPVSAFYDDNNLKKAVSDWAGSVWHVAIRGVIALQQNKEKQCGEHCSI